MDLGFSGEVTDFYHKYRRGYPAAAIDAVARTLHLTEDDIAIDLGCGTGQVTVPLAARVRAVVGIDPSPDMLARARKEAHDKTNVLWLLGADTDLPHLAMVVGEQSVAAITVGQALHWMDHETLFRAAKPLLRPGGGIAILTNGTPLWQQPADWSRALRAVMEEWLGTSLSYACGTDEQTQEAYADALASAGYDVTRAAVDYAEDLTLDQVIGTVFSAASEELLPRPSQRKTLTNQFRRALARHEPYREQVHVAVIIGRR